MLTLERLYDKVHQGLSLIDEDIEAADGFEAISDDDLVNSGAVPKKFVKFLLRGSGKKKTNNEGINGWTVTYFLHFPAAEWRADGEQMEDNYTWIEIQVKKEFKEQHAIPGQSAIKCYAAVQDEQSTDDVIVVRVLLNGTVET